MASSQESLHASRLRQYHPNISLPAVISAPTRPYALSSLAVAVSSAGGLGFISSTPGTGDAHQLAAARTALLPSSTPIEASAPNDTLTSRTTIADDADPAHPSPSSLAATLTALRSMPLPAEPIPVGIGYQIYQESLALKLRDIRTFLPSAVWLFAWRSTAMVSTWARAAYAASDGRAKIWIQVGTVQSALDVVRGCCDTATESSSSSSALPSLPLDALVLVAQGTDAGGHQMQRGASLLTLLPELLDALHEAGFGLVPVLGAGGIIEARGAAAALALGAAGVVLGTRLMGAREMALPEGFRRHVLSKRDGGVGTVTTRLFDRLRGTGDFPDGWYGRALINRSWEEVEGGREEGAVLKEYAVLAKKQLQQGTSTSAEGMYGDDGRLVEYAGTGVGLLKEVKGAAEIVEEIRTGSCDVLNRAANCSKI